MSGPSVENRQTWGWHLTSLPTPGRRKRTPEARGNPGCGCRRLQPARHHGDVVEESDGRSHGPRQVKSYSKLGRRSSPEAIKDASGG